MAVVRHLHTVVDVGAKSEGRSRRMEGEFSGRCRDANPGDREVDIVGIKTFRKLVIMLNFVRTFVCTFILISLKKLPDF
jgi:hypothetical protein